MPALGLFATSACGRRTGAVGADALAGLLEHLGVRQARVPLAQLRPVPARAH